MRLQPLNGHVLLEPVAPEEKTKGGIILPDTAREAPDEGVIEALPPNGSDEVAIGDRVLYKRYAGQEISFEGAKRRLVPVGDLLAKYVRADAIPD
ncbi:MAG: co-chaperone GroES [Deltaproteobacteria bacterium]|nr:co-chaperone GroES [Deltaproteobacteria bacterium]